MFIDALENSRQDSVVVVITTYTVVSHDPLAHHIYHHKCDEETKRRQRGYMVIDSKIFSMGGMYRKIINTLKKCKKKIVLNYASF